MTEVAPAPDQDEDVLEAVPTDIGPWRRLAVTGAWVAALVLAVIAGLFLWRAVLGGNPGTMERFRTGGGEVFTSRAAGFTARFPVEPVQKPAPAAGRRATITEATFAGTSFSVTAADAGDAELGDPTAAITQAGDQLAEQVGATIVSRTPAVNLGAVVSEIVFRRDRTWYQARLMITVDRFFTIQMASPRDDATLFHTFANSFHALTVR